MKIYVAAKFQDQRVVPLYAQLKGLGHTITHEWVHHTTVYPFSKEPTSAARSATQDLQGVMTADIVILLSNEQLSMGASTELGAALALFALFQKPLIYVVGPHFDTNIFYYHTAVIQKDTIEDVLSVLVEDKAIALQSVAVHSIHNKKAYEQE